MGEGSHIYGKNRIRTERDTERGHSQAENFALRKLESGIRRFDYEKSYIINSNGEVVAESKKKSKDKAALVIKGGIKDGILTHNHPDHLLTGLASRIGATFSERDLKTAVQEDLKEIRAVASNYIYSIKRPKKGWGKDAIKEIEKLFNIAESKTYDYLNTIGRKAITQSYLSTRDEQKARKAFDNANSRATLVHVNQGIRELAKKMGWKYSRQSNRK